MIATTVQGVDVFRRTAQGWKIYEHYGPGDILELESLDVHIPVAALYRRTSVPTTRDAPEGEV